MNSVVIDDVVNQFSKSMV